MNPKPHRNVTRSTNRIRGLRHLAFLALPVTGGLFACTATLDRTDADSSDPSDPSETPGTVTPPGNSTGPGGASGQMQQLTPWEPTSVGEACDGGCSAGQQCEDGACACASGFTLCGDRCVDLLSSGSDCGSCDRACEGDTLCSGGACVEDCADGLNECAQGCVNLETSALHCGKCDAPCEGGSNCSEGACTCPGSETLCSTGCEELDSDPNNCGSCGETCASDQFCSQGECVNTCPDGEIECGASCVDTDESVVHCGGCDSPCDDSELCDAGNCACATGFDLCDGDSSCDSLSTKTNCGSCGNSCDATGEYCDGADCTCGDDLEVCGGECVAPETAYLRDSDNCGSCGNVCSGGDFCRAGKCETPIDCSFEANAADSTGETGDNAGITERHNYWRWRVGEEPLTWHTGLAQDAQDYADTCPEAHDSSRGHAGFSYVGENLGWRWSSNPSYEASALSSVDAWIDEREDWSYGWAYGDHPSSPAIGHYTQAVWKNTTRIGCGVKHGCANLHGTSNTTGTTVVCRYGNGGNYSGQDPYAYLSHDLTKWEPDNACLDLDNDDVERQYDLDDTSRAIQ